MVMAEIIEKAVVEKWKSFSQKKEQGGTHKVESSAQVDNVSCSHISHPKAKGHYSSFKV